MNILRNTLKLIFVYCPIVVILIILGFTIQNNINSILDNLEPVVSKSATEFIGVPCQVDKIQISFLGINLKSVIIKDKENKDFIEAENVWVTLKPINFNTRNIQLKSVRVDKASVNIYRNKDWNFRFLDELSKKFKTSPMDIVGPVFLITNSQVKVYDSQTKYKDNISNINIRINLKDEKHPSIIANLDSNYIENIKYYVKFNRPEHIAYIKSNIKNINLSAFNEYKNLIPKNKATDIINKSYLYGSSNLNVSATIQDYKVKNYSIESINENVSAISPYGKLSKTNIYATCTNDILNFKTKGLFNSSETYIDGSLNIKKPSDIKGNISVKNVKSDYFKDFIPKEYASLKGSLDMSASIDGTIDNPKVSLNAKAHDIDYNGIKLKDLTLRTNYSNKSANYELYIKNQDKDIGKNIIPYNGEVYAKGNINNIDVKNFNPKKLTTNSIVSLRKLDLSNVPYCGGNAQGDINLKGYLLNPVINSNITIHEGLFKYKKLKYENLIVALSIDSNNKKFLVNSGLIKHIYNTDLIFRGYIDSKLNGSFSLEFNKLSLDELGKDFDIDIDGSASLSANISKNGDKITNTNLINIQNLTYNNQTVNHIQGNIELNNNGIVINAIHILDFPATFTFYGIITPNEDYLIPYDTAKKILNKEKIQYKERIDKFLNIWTLKPNKSMPLYFDLDINCNNYSTKSLFKRLNIKNEKIKAISNGNISLKGKFEKEKVSNLQGEGIVKVNDLNVYGYPFNNITANLDIKDDTIFLTKLQGNAVSFNISEENIFGNIEGVGKYNYITGDLEASVNLNNININDFRKYYNDYVNLYGILNTKCSINGIVNKDVQDINANISSNMPRLNINGKSYRNLNLNCNLQHSDLISGALSITKDNQSLNAHINDLSIKNKNVKKCDFSIKEMDINDLREIFYLSPVAKLPKVAKILEWTPIINNGTLNLEGDLSGKFEKINGNIELNASNINADFDQISKIHSNITSKDGKININSFEIYGTEFTLLCKGDFYNENLNLDLNLDNLPIERFNKYYKLDKLDGSLKAHALISGNYKKPNVKADFKVSNLKINDFKFHSLVSDNILIDPEYISLNEGLTLNLTDNNKLLITGKIPTNILENLDKELDINLVAENQDLDFIELFTPQITKNTTSGEFGGNLSIKGSLNEPKILGNFNISKGEIHTLGNTTIHELNSNIKINNDNDKLICNADFISKDDTLKENALSGYGEIILNNLREILNDQNSNVIYKRILNEASIKAEANLNDYYYISKDFTDFSDNSTTYLNGKVLVNGNLINPKIYTETPIVLNKLKTSIKTSANVETENQNTILMMAMKEQEESKKLFSFNDYIDYDEINLSEDRNNVLINPLFDIKATTKEAEIRPPATIIKANADVSIEGSYNSPYIKGSGVIQEGRTNFQIARARFIKGSKIDFVFKDWKANVNMDVHAFSNVHYSDKAGFDEKYKINIDITGNLDNYEISLTSDPDGLSKNEILRAFSGFSADNKLNAGNTLAAIGANTILSPVEDFFVEYLGFNYLNFTYKQDEYAVIDIERSFDNKFYGSFYSNLYSSNKTNKNDINNNISLWQLKLGYKFNKRFRVNVGINNKNDLSSEFSYQFRF